MRRELHLASRFFGSALMLFVLAACSDPGVVDTWEDSKHGVAVKVETLEGGGTRVKASYAFLGEQNLEELTARAEAGSVDAAMALGVLYWYGAGPEDREGKKPLPAHKTKAMGYYRQAAVRGHVPAQLILADLYASGADGIEQNLAEAARLYGKAAAAGELRAQCRLAAMYETGEGVDQDLSEAVELYHACAKGGDETAALRLAELYDTGDGVSENQPAAVEWYRRAAQANPRAHCRLAVLYDTGQGVEQDLSEAAALYRRCAETGDGPAMLRLAQLYEAGKGVPGDRNAALKWFRKAAAANQWQAQCRLGALYENGEGIKEDPAEAIKWYRLCAESGVGFAMFRLAENYDKGLGVTRDPGVATAYMMQALKQNVQQAKDAMFAGAKTWSQEFRQEFQRTLKAENLYSGPIDGILGGGTRNAIEAIASAKS